MLRFRTLYRFCNARRKRGSMKRNRFLVRWVIALAVLALVCIPRVAVAADNDILLGMFYASDSDHTDSIYLGYSDSTMTQVSSFYGSNYKDGNGNSHDGHVDPSIMFYNGKFWALSNWNRYDGRFWPMISYSTDLVHWTHPEGEGLITGTRGISLDSYPTCYNTSEFDVVAPEWFISKNGSVYIIFSAGFYGGFHGRPTEDKMQAYIVKVNELSADEGNADGNTGYLWPNNLRFNAGTAQRLNIPDNASDNSDYIDGAGFTEDGTDYLIIKKGGLTNQIFATSDIDSNQWQLINEQATFGYEGASIAKFDGRYMMAADHVNGTTADGVRMFSSGSLSTQNWTETGTRFQTTSGQDCAVRHGSIITLPAGSDGWNVARKLLDPSAEDTAMSVQYYVHRQTYGDEPAWSNRSGEQSGTTGESKRLEAIYIRVKNKPVAGNIQYKTHVQTYGWENDWITEPNMSGTSGQSKRLEAIQIRLTDQMADAYDVYYRVHAQRFGWMGWAKNGESAGTEGYAYRLEAIQIVLVDKDSAAPGADYMGAQQACSSAFRKKGEAPQPQGTSVQYYVHRQTYGDEEQWSKADGDQSGTTGESKRLEAIYIRTLNKPVPGDIQYLTHVQTYGWENDWITEPNMSGTSGQSKRLEAIKIRLTDQMADAYDVYYRVHAQRFGWMGWAKNGESAGTAGYSYRLEAIQIVLVNKDGAAPDANLFGAQQATAEAFSQKDAPNVNSKVDNRGLEAAAESTTESPEQQTAATDTAQADKPVVSDKNTEAMTEVGTEEGADATTSKEVSTAATAKETVVDDEAAIMPKAEAASAEQIDLATDKAVKVELKEEGEESKVVVSYGEKELVLDEDYTLTSQTDEAGTTTMTIEGKGTYKGELKFEVKDGVLVAMAIA